MQSFVANRAVVLLAPQIDLRRLSRERVAQTGFANDDEIQSVVVLPAVASVQTQHVLLNVFSNKLEVLFADPPIFSDEAVADLSLDRVPKLVRLLPPDGATKLGLNIAIRRVLDHETLASATRRWFVGDDSALGRTFPQAQFFGAEVRQADEPTASVLSIRATAGEATDEATGQSRVGVAFHFNFEFEIARHDQSGHIEQSLRRWPAVFRRANELVAPFDEVAT